MNRNPDRTAETRQNLVDAFWTLYCRKGIERISVKEVAAKAGYNRGTFYEYFRDVYGVLEHLELSLLPAKPEDLPPFGGDRIADAGHPLDPFIKMYERNRAYFVVLLGEHGDPAFQARIKRHMRPMLQGMLPARTKADAFEVDFIIEFVLSAMIGVLSHWFSREHEQPSERLIALMYDLLDNGAMRRLRVNESLMANGSNL